MTTSDRIIASMFVAVLMLCTAGLWVALNASSDECAAKGGHIRTQIVGKVTLIDCVMPDSAPSPVVSEPDPCTEADYTDHVGDCERITFKPDHPRWSAIKQCEAVLRVMAGPISGQGRTGACAGLDDWEWEHAVRVVDTEFNRCVQRDPDNETGDCFR